MKKTLRKIIPAIAMLLISATLVGTSTFAWFSMNNKVTISGMSVTTKVSSNLFVASGTAGTTRAADNAFSASVNQTVEGLIEPVSTVNGENFFYTTSGLADGNSAAEDYVAYNPADTSAFNTAYGTTGEGPSGAGAVGYVDYVIDLKAINTSESASKYIALTKLDLVYTGTATDNTKAHRVAMFVQDGDYSGEGGAFTAFNAKAATATCIIDVTGAENQTADNAVSAAGSAPTAISIMATQALTSIEVAANSTKYFKVTLRLYVEGEDKTCTNEYFLKLTSAWRLETQFELKDNATSSITEITKYAAKTVEIAGDNTIVYLDSSNNLFKAADMTQLNGTGDNAKNISVAATGMTASEVTALNTEFGLTGGANEFTSIA